VEGQATLDGQPLGIRSAGYTVAQPNQAIDTQTGYVEVLLTPGAFLRVGNNSEVRFQSLGLANIQIQLVRGSAMIEAADLVKDAVLEVNMNGGTAQIEKHGLYEFDANQPAVKVLDGKAKVQVGTQVKSVGKDHQILLADNPKLKDQDFDKHVVQAEPLYVWSSTRSQAEAESNIKVASNIAAYGGWYGPGWYWDPFWADYAFLPGAGFLYSPFGWGFYSPGFVYAAPLYRTGFYGHGFYRGGYGRVNGVAAVHAAAPHAAFVGGGFHGGGFHGGGHR
jgi:hypothetical protein